MNTLSQHHLHFRRPDLRGPSSTPTPRTSKTQTMVWVFPPHGLSFSFPQYIHSLGWSEFWSEFSRTMVWVSSREGRNTGVGVDEWAWMTEKITLFKCMHIMPLRGSILPDEWERACLMYLTPPFPPPFWRGSFLLLLHSRACCRPSRSTLRCCWNEKNSLRICFEVWSFRSHALFILSADDLPDFSGTLWEIAQNRWWTTST